MRIELYIYIGVVMILMACGSYRKTTGNDMEVKRETVRYELTDMSGIEVERWAAWMSEGLTIEGTEIHYSAPDSTGKQHITKTVTRKTEAGRDIRSIGEVVDSIATHSDVEEWKDEDVSVEVKEEKSVNKFEKVWFIVFVLAIALAVYKL